PNAGGSRIYLSDMGFSTDEEIEALEKEMGVTFPTYYYKWDEENQRVTWTTDINEATEVFTTKENNSVVFKGLTDGKYTIIEKTVPDGYNKAEDYNFTIEKNNYSADNLEQSATVTNQAGSALPNTGGPGTRLFTILGSILILGAGVLLWRRRRLI
ncbi:MAG: LPXTG cell wall anchor domain-containing protein, partial [Oribacterium sp.]|nr:LPXTG cell wall anchor domain-containing protein [Oribacterium sp.]